MSDLEDLSVNHFCDVGILLKLSLVELNTNENYTQCMYCLTPLFIVLPSNALLIKVVQESWSPLKRLTTNDVEQKMAPSAD